MTRVVNPTEWARNHKREFAADVLSKCKAVSAENPIAVFMAGLPGAGKTEFIQNFMKRTGIEAVRIDMDEIATHIEFYSPRHADMYREGATMLLNKLFDLTIKRKLDFIMDGTFGSKNALPNVKRSLKKGYLIKVFYIVQDPVEAWHFTRMRELVEKRGISLDGFIDTYYNLSENLKTLLNLNLERVTVDAIIKGSGNKISGIQEHISRFDIDKMLESKYNSKNNLRKALGM